MLSRSSKIISRHYTRSSRVSSYGAFRLLTKSYASASSGTVSQPLKVNQTAENNLKTETNRVEKTLSKFWEKVSVKESDAGLEVQLDNKTMKTPLGHKLILPKSRRTLAHLVANEWRNVPSLSIRSHSLPLTSLVSRVIDLEQSKGTEDPEVLARVGRIDDVKEDLLRYLDTDTFLVFSPHADCDGTLRPAQEEMYRPIIKSLLDYIKSRTGLESVELSYLDCEVALLGNSQSEETKQIFRQWMATLDTWQVVALEKATLTAKSFLSGVALIRMHDKSVELPEHEVLEVEDIAKGATLETIYQTARWGEVEDTHDVDKVDVRRNLASASLIIYEH